MDESEKIKLWLGIGVGWFVFRQLWLGYKAKIAEEKGTVGSARSPMVDPRGIVDVRAAPGVARVTL